MNLAFLVPAGLAALAALALPLLIHLARRSEQRPTVFAALQWLRAKPRPRTRLRFDEWLLLALRLLLLALCALLLAHPVVSGIDDATPVVAVVPGAQPPAAEGFAQDARWHWLAPGFPVYRTGDTPPVSTAPPTSLLRELDAELPRDVAITVLTPPELHNVDAQRPRLSRAIEWRVVPGAIAAPPVARPATAPRLSIRYADTHASAVRYLRAARTAWGGVARPGTSADDIASVDRAIAPGVRHLAWIAPGPVPKTVRDWVNTGGVLLLDASAQWPVPLPMSAVWRDGPGAVIEGAPFGRGRVLRFTRALVPQQMPVLLDGAFPSRLRGALEPAPPMPSRVLAAAHAPLNGGPAFVPAPRDLAPWLVLAITLVFIAERWVATGRRGRDAP